MSLQFSKSVLYIRNIYSSLNYKSQKVRYIQMKEVLITFKVHNVSRRQQFQSLEQLMTCIEEQEKRYQHKIQAYIRDKQRYKNYNKNIREYFEKDVEDSNEDPLEIELLYKDVEDENTARTEIIKKKATQLNENIISKLQFKEEGQLLLMKKFTKLVSYDENQYKKIIQLLYFVSDPLVRKDKTKLNNKEQIIVSKHTKEFNFRKNQEFMKLAHANNYQIDIITNKQYISKKTLDNVHKKSYRADALIFHIYLSIIEQNGLYYVLVQDQQNIGLQTRINIQHFFNKFNKINTLYLLIITGKNLQLIKDQLLQIEINVPIILIPTFQVDDDAIYQSFMKCFYSHLFQRKTIEESFNIASKKITEQTKNFQCCCLHSHQENCVWNQLVDNYGNSILHKIFGHDSKTQYSQFKSKVGPLKRKLTKVNSYYDCCETQSIHPKRKVYFVKKQINNFLQYPEERIEKSKEKIAGRIIECFEPIRNEGRFRNKIIYKFIQAIWKDKQNLICVVGRPKSGKSKFIHLALEYIYERKKKEVFEYFDISEEYKKNKSKAEKEIKSKIKRGKHIVFIIGRIPSSDHEKFEQFYNKIVRQLRNEKVKLIVSSPTQIRRINNKMVCIQKLTENEMLSLILRGFNKKFFLLKNPCQILDVMQKSELQLLQLQKFMLIINRQIDSRSQVNLEQLQSKMEQFKNRVQNRLYTIQNSNKNRYDLHLFFSNFTQGLNLCKCNQIILSQMFNIQVDKSILQLQSDYNLYEINQFSYSQDTIPKGLILKPNNIMLQHCKQYKQQSFQKKCVYFYKIFGCAREVLMEMKDLYPQKRKVLNNEGILQFKIKSENHENKWNFIKYYDLSAKENYLRHFLDYNFYNFICYLKEITLSKELRNINPSTKQNMLSSIVNALIIHKVYYPRQDQKKKFYEMVTEILPIFQNDTIQSIILQAQAKSLIYSGKLAQLKHKVPSSDDKHTFIRNMIDYQVRLIDLWKKKKILTSQKTNKDDQLEGIGHTINKLMIQKLQQNIKILQKTDHLEEFWGVTPARMAYLIIGLVIKKTVLRFQYDINTSQSHRLHYFYPKNLQEQFIMYQRKCKKLQYWEKQIMLCLQYLKLNTDVLKPFQFKFSKNQISSQLINLYNYIAQKKNPTTLLKRDNIILFMKARCLQVKKQPCAFVRKGNIIKSYLGSQLKYKKINLLFLNLTMENFRIVSNGRPSIFILVLTIDILNEGKLKLVFQNQFQCSERICEFNEFIEELKKIDFTFLLLFGSQTHKLASLISSIIQPQKDAFIFSFSSNKRLLLSNYPQADGLKEIIEEFVQNENSQRAIEMIACSMISQIVRREGKIITSQILQKIATNSIKMSTQIISKWNRNQNNEIDINYKLFQLGNTIMKRQFPTIEQGRYEQLSKIINRIDHNFTDQSFYQTVGRTQEIVRIVGDLNKYKKCLIEISGKQKSGKRQLLKQLGWFCQTRHLFALGVYLYDMRDVRKDQCSIAQYLTINNQENLNLRLSKVQKMEDAKHCLLLLLENLQKSDISQNKEFFDQISRGPISLIYTTQRSSIKETFEQETSIQFNREEIIQKKQSLDSYELILGEKKSSFFLRKWQWSKILLNQIKKKQKICMVLARIRHLPFHTYEKMLKDIIDPEFVGQKSILSQLLQRIDKELRKKEVVFFKSYLSYDCEKLLEITEHLQKIYIKIIRDLKY